MDTGELQRGNRILGTNNLVGTVTNINRSTVRYNVDNELESVISHHEELNPIPISKKWFNRLDVNQIDRLFKVLPLKFEHSMGNKVTLKLIGIENDVIYEYVHQMQNIISSLSGEELKIKD